MRTETEIKIIPASEEREERIVTYIAEDGKRFTNPHHCQLHEEYLEHLRILKSIKKKEAMLPDIFYWYYVENKDQIYLIRDELSRYMSEIHSTIGLPKVGEWCGAYEDSETDNLIIISFSEYKEMIAEFLNSFKTTP